MTSFPQVGSAGESVIAAFLLADSRLPSGAYSHSAGLEPAVIAGLQVDGVYPYLISRLQTTGRMETVAAVLAHRRAREICTELREDDGGAPGFAGLEAALDARTPSAAQREASRRLGRGMLRLAATLKPGDPAVAALKREAPRPPRPVALGVAAHALGVDRKSVVEERVF